MKIKRPECIFCNSNIGMRAVYIIENGKIVRSVSNQTEGLIYYCKTCKETAVYEKDGTWSSI